MMRALLGLIGANIGRSLTPAMHEAAGPLAGLDIRYHLIDTALLRLGEADLPRMMDGVRTLGFRGVNVTFPWKVAVLSTLDSVEQSACAVGAANTVVVSGGKLTGHNTDCSGFQSAWRRVFGERQPGTVALLGAGGVGRAIAHALAMLGAKEVRLMDVEVARAHALGEALRTAWPGLRTEVASDARSAATNADGIVNATPLGMHAHPGNPFPAELPSGASWVADAVYTPIETEFVGKARRAGVAVMTGQELAIAQAVDAFALFFGIPAPAEAMRAAFLAGLKSAQASSPVTPSDVLGAASRH